MADKFSVLIKYEYLDFIEKAKLSDADSWILMKALIEYDKTGKEPVFDKRDLSLLFIVFKNDLDKNRKKWEEAIKAKSEAGKKGMEKRWADKKQDITQITDITDDNTNNSNNRCYQAITGVTNITDSGNDLDPDNEFDSGGGNDHPPLILIIKNQIKENGFFLDEHDIERLTVEVDPSWFENHSFIAFIAETVRDRYAGNKTKKQKTDRELHNLFRKLLFSAPNLREEYPTWRAKRLKQDKEAAKDAEIETARNNHPTKCLYCGGEDLREYSESFQCKKCSAISSFNKNKLIWEWRE